MIFLIFVLFLFLPSSTINFLSLIKMEVTTPVPGFVSYEFYKEVKIKILWVYYYSKSYISQEKLNKNIQIGYWAGLAIAGTIILATLIEDVCTAGAGIANDPPSMVAAANSFQSCVALGMALL